MKIDADNDPAAIAEAIVAMGARIEAAARFWPKVDFSPSGHGCDLWTRATDSQGYGVFTFRGKRARAHRVAWELTHAEHPTGQIVHTCEHRRCVKDEHLRHVVPREDR